MFAMEREKGKTEKGEMEGWDDKAGGQGGNCVIGGWRMTGFMVNFCCCCTIPDTVFVGTVV